MKNLALFLLLIASLNLTAQNISGLYSGTLQNDSAKVTQQYELALSEYRNKVTGYAYATFIANDTFYYSIRRVKAVRDGNQLIVEDEQMLANNFPVKPDKGVHRISYIPLQNLKEGDTLTTFTGNWKTTGTKKFYSVPGTMDLKRNNDSSQSALIAHLLELDIIASQDKRVAHNPPPAQSKIAVTPVQTKQETVATTQKPVKEGKHEPLKKLKKTAVKPTTDAEKTTLIYTERRKTAPQVFDIGSDSLVLSFYDNGVVDGDIISVYVNGSVVVSQVKLLEAATKKTIHFSAATDSVELLLVAETLGSIPPNTGLLVVQDGNARYDVRFSADLQTNASIVFRKRK